MAEIILEPTVQSKVIPLSLRLNDTDTSLVSQLVTNRQFNTADTDAWFSFTLEGLAATTGTFDLTLINLHDKSVFNHTDKVFNTNPFYYKLDSGTDELTNEIRHAGKWVGQLVVTLANGDSATRKFIFGIEGHILDGTVVQTILLEDYNALIASIESAKDELTQYNIEYASLIGTVTEQEAARLEAEELRVIADALRETKEGVRQATFEANEVIRDGVVDSAIEGEMIAQTVETKLTEKEATYAPRLVSVEQQLAQTTKDLTNKKQQEASRFTTYSSTNKKPFITFMDDDISIEVMTKLYPVFTSKNVPCNLSVVSSAVDTDRKIAAGATGSMTTSDLKKVMGHGWELLGHSHAHNPNLLAYDTEQEVEDDIRTCKEFLESIGSFDAGFVYPQSAHNEATRRLVNKYFDFSFSGSNFNDNVGTNNMQIRRIAFGYSSSQNPAIVNGVQRADTLEYYKACVDYAGQTGSWLVFMLHAWDVNFNIGILDSLIDYILDSKITIGNASNGYKIFGLSSQEKTILKDSEISPNAPITSFPMGESILNFGNAEVTQGGLPTGTAGTLITHRNGIEYYYNRQEYWVYLTQNERYYRYSTSETEWSDWVRSTDPLFRDDVILNTNGPNLFPDESVTVDRISTLHAVGKGFPTEQEATIKTESYTNGPGFNTWQTYMTTNGKHVYKRVKGSTTTWTSWSRVNIGNLTPSERNSLPKTTGDCVYDIYLNKPVWVNTVGNWVDATGTPV